MPQPATALPCLDTEDIVALIDEYLPIVRPVGNVRLRATGEGCLVFSADGHQLQPRPGGTISGPALFAVMDLASFFTVNAYLGRMPAATLLQANIDFLEAAEAGPLTITVEPVKLARRFAVTSVRVNDDLGSLVATASLVFALPSRTRTSRRDQDASVDGTAT